jgi:hypothetical protein
VTRGRKATRDHRAIRVPAASRDLPETPDQRATRELRDLMAVRAYLARREIRVQWETRALLARRVIQARPADPDRPVIQGR